jgi:Ca2+-transporting ATPase
MFSTETFQNPTLLKAIGLSVVAIIVMSELRLFNRILDTVNLEVEQWLIAILVSLLVVALAEGKKLLRIGAADAGVPAASAPTAASAS